MKAKNLFNNNVKTLSTMNKREEIEQKLEANEETTIFYDGFDEAIIGVEIYSFRVIYSVQKCIEILCKDMPEEDAMEHFGYNVTGGYVGEKTPIFCDDEF
jgi:hypothetical protein